MGDYTGQRIAESVWLGCMQTSTVGMYVYSDSLINTLVLINNDSAMYTRVISEMLHHMYTDSNYSIVVTD